MSSRTSIHAALFFVALLFSVNYIVSKVTMRGMTPMTFAWLRVVGSTILLQATVRNRVPLERGDLARIALFAILGVVINQTLFLGGLSRTSAHLAAILITTIPVFTLAAAIVSRAERATAAKVGGIALAAAGALLIVGIEGIAGTKSSLTGTVMLLVNCLSYSLYLVLSKPVVTRLSATTVVTHMFTMGAVLMLPLALPALIREPWQTIPASGWAGLAFVIVGPTVGAYLLNAWALARADSSLVAGYTYLQPLIASILATVFLQEAIGWNAVVAGLLIFTGIYLAGLKLHQIEN